MQSNKIHDMDGLSLDNYEDVRIKMPWGHLVGRWYGNRQVRPILALHGWLDNIGTWEPLIPYLPAHIGLLCIDLPGHGHSSHLPLGISYAFEEYQSVIRRIMKEYKWQRISLMGHSAGSAISHLFAALNPHYVDMVIGIDLIKAPFYTPKSNFDHLRSILDKFFIADERLQADYFNEPRSYTYEELETIYCKIYQIAKDKARCIIHGGVIKSKLHPNRYYLSRDIRVKYIRPMYNLPANAVILARRIKNIPYLVIKGTDSNYINEDSNEVISILREQNKHFQLHVIKGPHHVHLENPKECASILVPFINRWHPVSLTNWMIEEFSELEESKEIKRKRLGNFFIWNKDKNPSTESKSKL